MAAKQIKEVIPKTHHVDLINDLIKDAKKKGLLHAVRILEEFSDILKNEEIQTKKPLK